MGAQSYPASQQCCNSDSFCYCYVNNGQCLRIPARALNNGNLSRLPEYVLESGLTSVQKHELLTFKLGMARETTVDFPSAIGEDFFSVWGQENATGFSGVHSLPDFYRVTQASMFITKTQLTHKSSPASQ